MAKDPAFLFYPGDASEDTQFMNRLERGCYFDILKAQKKFGKFSMQQIKKVLGADFESCWPSLEAVLKFENDFYYIEWLSDSIEKRKLFSESRSKNRKKKTSDEDMINICTTHDNHMVNGNEIENKIVIEDFGKSENLLLGDAIIPQMARVFYEANPGYAKKQELDFPPLVEILKFAISQFSHEIDIGNETDVGKIIEKWRPAAKRISQSKFWKNKPLKSIVNNIQEFFNQENNETNKRTNSEVGKTVQFDRP